VHIEPLQVQVAEEGGPLNLAGWLCRPRQERKSAPGQDNPLLILCHGIPRARPAPQEEDSGDDGGYAALAERCCALGIPVFHFNFRGTGESEGNFDLSGWVRDLEAVFRYWDEKEPRRPLLLWGFSGGAAVSACAAPKNSRVQGVILAACPASFESLFPQEKYQEIIAWFREVGIIKDPGFPARPHKWLQDIHLIRPVDEVFRIAPAPLLVLHGAEDELVPPDQAELLFKNAGEPKEKAILPGAGHQLRKHPQAVQVALDWLTGILESS